MHPDGGTCATAHTALVRGWCSGPRDAPDRTQDTGRVNTSQDSVIPVDAAGRTCDQRPTPVPAFAMASGRPGAGGYVGAGALTIRNCVEGSDLTRDAALPEPL